MILVVGRPGLDERDGLDRLAGRISVAAAEAGGRVELVGSVGDDPDGERVVLALGRAGVGHAALLRDPAGTTPRVGGPGGPLPRLDEADVQLGLAYLVDCRALVIAESLPDAVMRIATESAAYHGAALVVVVEVGQPPPPGLDESATVLEQPAGDDSAFAVLVARYAVELARGTEAAEAWQAAVGQAGWEPVAAEEA